MLSSPSTEHQLRSLNNEKKLKQMSRKEKIKLGIEESRRINAALNRAVKGLKSVDTSGIILSNAPPRRKVNPDNTKPSDPPKEPV